MFQMGPKTREGSALWASGEGRLAEIDERRGSFSEVTEVKNETVNSTA
jgi:hypothetical protein